MYNVQHNRRRHFHRLLTVCCIPRSLNGVTRSTIPALDFPIIVTREAPTQDSLPGCYFVHPNLRLLHSEQAMIVLDPQRPKRGCKQHFPVTSEAAMLTIAVIAAYISCERRGYLLTHSKRFSQAGRFHMRIF